MEPTAPQIVAFAFVHELDLPLDGGQASTEALVKLYLYTKNIAAMCKGTRVRESLFTNELKASANAAAQWSELTSDQTASGRKMLRSVRDATNIAMGVDDSCAEAFEALGPGGLLQQKLQEKWPRAQGGLLTGRPH